MADPTLIEVSVDRTEYSRYEDGRDKIVATVVSSIDGGGAFDGEEVTVELRKGRRNRDAVVASATLTLAGSSPNEAVVVFDLPNIVDADELHLTRWGTYFVYAVFDEDLPTEVAGESDDFELVIFTVERLKEEYLFGVNLTATEVYGPKFQPQVITGVEICEVSRRHPLGFGTLTYNYTKTDVTDATAAIGSGADGTVNITADGDNGGSTGNSLTVVVATGLGTVPLSATFADSVLLVTLSALAGAPVAVDNTATLVAAAIDAIDGFTATASGTGATSLSSAEGPTAFSGGVSSIVKSLSWNGGTAVPISSPGKYVLRNGSAGCDKFGNTYQASDYITVRVTSSALLPTETISEEILIERDTIDDAALANYIKQATVWLEEVALAVRLEPTNVVTDVDPTQIQYTQGVSAGTPIFVDTDFDFVESPLTYFVRHASEWVTIRTPYMSLLRIDNLFGAIANVRVIDIELDWIEHSEKGGLVQLVPFNQEIAFDFVGLIWSNMLRGATALPNFWRFNMIVGLRDCPASLQEVIGKKAAIDALTMLGNALRPGVGSTSLSRDGVSESISYTNQAQYGAYSGPIAAFKEYIDKEIWNFRRKYRGLDMVVV